MKRVLVLTCALVLAFSALAWGDVNIDVYGFGTGEIEIVEMLYTDFGQIFEYFYADGDYDFYKDVYVWEDWLTGSGGISEYKYFLVDGFVSFDERVYVYEPDLGDFEMGAYTSVVGEGYILFEKYVYAGYDDLFLEGYLMQDVFVEGFVDWGYVYIGHTGTSFDWWYIDQDYQFNLWTPTVDEHVSQWAFLGDGDSNWFGVGVFLDWEPFQISSFIDDLAW